MHSHPGRPGSLCRQTPELDNRVEMTLATQLLAALRRPNIDFSASIERHVMNALIVALVALAVVALIGLSLSVKVVTQYQRGVLFRLGKVVAVKEPGLTLIIPVIDRLVRVSLRIVTMPIQSQGIITRDNVSVDISAVAYFRVVDPVKSVIAIENVDAAINQIAQTTLRKVVGQHTLDEALSETDVINANIQKILDVATLEWGVAVNLVELKDIQLPDSMKRAMARQAEAERRSAPRSLPRRGIDGRRCPWGPTWTSWRSPRQLH